jgi:glycyl-tRNA synthetase
MKEFEQMEIEYFVMPEEADKWYEYWIDEHFKFYHEELGIKKESLKLRVHRQDELAHYAKACTDIEFKFPFGWKELEGIANRGDFDLREHSKFSKKGLSYFDQKSNKSLYPYVIEPSAGLDRMFFAVVSDAYHEEEVQGRKRVVLRLDRRIAPYKIAVFPLLKNRAELVELAKKIHYTIKSGLKVKTLYDDTGSIGKLYRPQDEIGTPFCVTVDVDSLSDRKVTVRERDSMLQERIPIQRLEEYLKNSFLTSKEE